ncbi:type II toxin-antitoxin system RelE/ParE family toxin [Rhizobium sp. SL86]|uniref:type II toxin-antitoxin system RelE/ParE family toxin n=1 Tax=Rhizobium sp. SL86 TaxID=2995148 RepID=UPI002276F1C4|nr:type II toxin-antitoxin system RelE/ParE family toxin [Rhizobium sp. SL86]MCY1664441.1 type II toxin-antitoxin system RelE/ParE family toxin [Rhizobium sp. SL86]
MKVTLSPKALEYVRREARYLSAVSPKAGHEFSNDLKRLRHDLLRFPEMGKANDEIPIPGVLRFVMGAYLVDYEVRGKQILILAIRHGRERPPALELGDDFDVEDQ